MLPRKTEEFRSKGLKSSAKAMLVRQHKIISSSAEVQGSSALAAKHSSIAVFGPKRSPLPWSLGVGVPPEISNAMLGRLSAMRAGNIRESSYRAEIIKELITFLVLAVKHPHAIISANFVHSGSLSRLKYFSIELMKTPVHPLCPLVRTGFFR